MPPAVLREQAHKVTQRDINLAMTKAVNRSNAYSDRLMADHVQMNMARGWLLAIGFLAIATICNVLLTLLVVTHG